MPQAEAAVMVVLISVSAATWWLWRQRSRLGRAVEPVGTDPTVHWNPIAIVLAIGFVAVSLVATWQPSALSGGEPAAPSVAGVLRAGFFNALLFAVLLALLPSPRSRLADFGIHWRDWQRSVRDGIEVGMASFLPVFAVLLLTAPLRSGERVHSLLKFLQQDLTIETLAAVALTAVVLAPLAEELLFRVILLRWLKSRMASRPAIVLSSLAFAGVHDFPDCLALVPLALLLGSSFDRRPSLLTVFVAHAFFNFANIVLTLAKR